MNTSLQIMQQEVSDSLRRYVERSAKSGNNAKATLGNIIGYLIGTTAGAAQGSVPPMGEDEFVHLCRKIYIESKTVVAEHRGLVKQ